MLQKRKSVKSNRPRAGLARFPQKPAGSFRVPPGVEDLIERQGMTLRQLGLHLGKSTGLVSRKVAGRVAWRYDELLELAAALKVDIRDLL